jgi:hypothetical protein
MTGPGGPGGPDREPGTGLGAGTEPAAERELRYRFAALRRQEAEAAPGLGTLLDRAAADRLGTRRPGSRLRQPAVAAVAAAIALLALVVMTLPSVRTRMVSPRPRWVRPVPSITAWRAPTDFLLHTPGEEILGAAPAFGRIPSLGIATQPHDLDRLESHRRLRT